MCFLLNRCSRFYNNSVRSSISSSVHDLVSDIVSRPRVSDTLLTVADKGIDDSVVGVIANIVAY